MTNQSCLLLVSRAPEQVDKEFGLRGTYTDVWGFATTVLHLATGQLPYHGLTHLQIMFAMSKGRTPDVPSSLPMWLQKALTSCLTFDTAACPSMSQLHQVRCDTNNNDEDDDINNNDDKTDSNNNSNSNNNVFQLMMNMQVTCVHFKPLVSLFVLTRKC